MTICKNCGRTPVRGLDNGPKISARVKAHYEQQGRLQYVDMCKCCRDKAIALWNNVESDLFGLD